MHSYLILLIAFWIWGSSAAAVRKKKEWSSRIGTNVSIEKDPIVDSAI
jgi:hypothetical protein